MNEARVLGPSEVHLIILLSYEGLWHWVTCYAQAGPGPLGLPQGAIPDH